MCLKGDGDLFDSDHLTEERAGPGLVLLSRGVRNVSTSPYSVA